jgi:hypothetical protein
MAIPSEELSAPFPPEQVKQRRGSFGKQLAYVEAWSVVHRLNSVLADGWSFRVIDTRVETDEVIVLGQLTVGNSVRQQYGSSRITRNRDTGEILNLGDDMKAATSDCLKKSASLFGVALYLYDGSARVGDADSGKVATNRSSGNVRTLDADGGQGHDGGPLSSDHIARIVAIAKDAGLPQRDLITLTRDTFSTSLSQLSPVQADELIALISNAA